MIIPTIAGVLLGGLHSQFQEPLLVAEPARVALTPKIDGVRQPFEWDVFAVAGAKESCLQWEPGELYAAASLGANEDLVISLDARNDGWLVGRDNLQLRVEMADGRPVVKTQRLDGTNPAGPVWVDAPDVCWNLEAAATQVADGWFVELSSGHDSRLDPDLNSKMGVRIDAVAHGSVLEPYLPRVMTACNFVFDRGSSLPGGFKWHAQTVTRTVSPGETMRVRVAFNGDNAMNLQRVDFSPKSGRSEALATLSYPFPRFDRKGRAFVDYQTPIPADAEPGFRLLNAVVTDDKGNAAFLRTSFRVAPIFETLFDDQTLKTSDKERTLRFSYKAQSNTNNRLHGQIKVVAPEDWSVVSGQDKAFDIYNRRSAVRRVFEIKIPAGAQGKYPIDLNGTIGDKRFSHRGWITIE